MCSAEMIDVLLSAGVDSVQMFEGCTGFGYAKVFGYRGFVMAMVHRGVATELTKEEGLFAKATDGANTKGQFVDSDKLPNSYRNIIRTNLYLPSKLDRVKRLVAIGFDMIAPSMTDRRHCMYRGGKNCLRL